MLDFYDVVGLTGVCLSTYSYARVQWQRDFAKTFSYSILNLVASAMIFMSLTERWNLPSVVSSVVWGLISLYGIYRCSKYAMRVSRSID